MEKNFRIYRSSAGSGKTYALVRQYIKLALLGDSYGFRPRYFRHILAITFTNKAASEMKERVLSFLSDLKEGKGKGEQHSFFSHIQEDTGLSIGEVQLRAAAVLSAVLHHYSDLSISTIDKFVYRIVRTFAHDLELAHNFEVEMDAEKLIQPAVALLVSRVGSNEALSNALVDFSLNKALEGKSYKLEQDLGSFAKHLFAEEADKHIQSLKAIGIADCLEVKSALQTEIVAFESILLNSTQQFESFCLQHQLSERSFYQGDYYRYIMGLKKRDATKLFPGKRLKTSMESNRWYAKTTAAQEQEVIDQYQSFLKDLYEDLQLHLQQGFKQYVFNKLLIKNIYSIAVLNELSEELDNYKAEHNIKHISEFNKAIANIIREEPAPFIYERLGERYRHYLVDEFQDTSVMQWHNLLPLVHHALSIGSENLIVGDAKQSIYRWRGGEVEQFVKLPSEIHKKSLLPNGDEVLQAVQRNAEEMPLDSNWRSAQEVVEFNNRFFDCLKGKLNPDLQKIYEGHAQLPKGKAGGLVRIDFLEKSKTIEADIMQRLIAKAEELLALGYEWKDMAVLCRTRKDATTVAHHLNRAGVAVVSDEALLLNTSSEVNLLLSLLQYLHDDRNQIAASDIIHYLHQKGRLEGELHSLLLTVSKEGASALLSLLKAAQIPFNPLQLWQLPIYDLVEKLIKDFRLPLVDIYLQFFLDAVLKFSVKQGNEVQAFLSWWEEEENKEAIVVSDEMNAVKVMTVHKSKGLEFPIVFIPFNWSVGKPSKELWVDAQGKISQLKVALLTNSKLLEDSEYASDRQLELDKALLDDLNVLYVAMTRPQKQLYILTEQPSKSRDVRLNKLTKLLEVFLPQHDFSMPYQEGELTAKKQGETKIAVPVYALDYQATENWRSVVQLKNAAKQLWDIDLEKKEWGTLLHTALAKIHYLSDKEAVLASLKRNGLLNDALKERLEERITNLLNDPEILPFFSEEWEVKTEQEILRKGGDTYIPDRLLFKANEVQVVDYKTGSRAKMNEHSDQIKNYAHLLQQMGYQNISCYLIYTEEQQKVIQLN